MILPTIAIEHPDSPNAFLIINEQDFDPTIHKPFKKKPKTIATETIVAEPVTTKTIEPETIEPETIVAEKQEPKAKSSKK